jgi:hypothetical protein
MRRDVRGKRERVPAEAAFKKVLRVVPGNDAKRPPWKRN